MHPRKEADSDHSAQQFAPLIKAHITLPSKRGTQLKPFPPTNSGYERMESSTPSDLEQFLTIKTPITARDIISNDLSSLQTAMASAVTRRQEPDKSLHEQAQPQSMSEMPHLLNTEDDALKLDTVSMQSIHKKRVNKRIGAFFSNVAILIAGLLFLCLLGGIIIVLPNPMYKAVVFLVFLITLSYLASIQMRLRYRAKQDTFLTTTQFVHAVGKKHPLSKEKDMGHLTLIKQDTTSFLRAIATKDLKKDTH
jgi:hypothetical protein